MHRVRLSVRVVALCTAALVVLVTVGCAGSIAASDRDVPRPVLSNPMPPEAQPPAGEQSSVPLTEPLPVTGPLAVSLERALLLSLEGNAELRAQRLTPAIRRTFEEEERAAFDPVFAAQANRSRVKAMNFARTGTGFEKSDVNNWSWGLSLQQLLPTGTKFSLDYTTTSQTSSLYTDSLVGSRIGGTVSQALLRGGGPDVGLVNLQQARLDTRISEFEFRAFVEALVAHVEQTYWDYALAIRQVEIFQSSVTLAEQQLNETNEKIQVGKLPETERAAAQAEVAQRKEQLIEARGNAAKFRLLLLRLLNPDGESPWSRPITLLDHPFVPVGPLEDVEDHALVGLKFRPDLNQARLGVQRADLEVIRTKNGLLPRLDFTLTAGSTGYSSDVWQTFHHIGGVKTYDIRGGVELEQALFRRAEEARHRRAVYSERQVRKAVENLAQLVQVDVRTAYVEVEKAREQIVATNATRKLREEALRAETEKFQVGKSTSLLVGQAQRDCVASQIAEIEAVVNHLKALVELYRLEGSLLERRGVVAPGRGTVEMKGQAAGQP